MTDPVLILGAGQGQLPLYQEVARRGLPVIAVDRNHQALGLRYASEHLPLSIREAAPIIAAVGARTPAAVLAGGAEQSTLAWSELSAHYRTPYQYPRSAALASIDKGVFHTIAARAGVNTYRWQQGGNISELAARAAEVGFPLVAKPADGAGKKGIALATTPDELDQALRYAAGSSPGGSVVIEQLLRGRDLTIDVFLKDGEPTFAAIHEKRLDPASPFRVQGHVTPAPLPEATSQRLIGIATRLCHEIGLTDGPADFDLFLSGDTVQVVEVNARLPGEGVPAFLRTVYGVDLVGGLVSLALGEPVDVRQRQSGAGIVHAIASPLPVTGVVRELSGLALARAVPGVARLQLYAEPGDLVPPFPQFGNEIGYLVVTGEDLATAQARLAEALAHLTVTIVAHGGPAASAAAGGSTADGS